MLTHDAFGVSLNFLQTSKHAHHDIITPTCHYCFLLLINNHLLYVFFLSFVQHALGTDRQFPSELRSRSEYPLHRWIYYPIIYYTNNIFNTLTAIVMTSLIVKVYQITNLKFKKLDDGVLNNDSIMLYHYSNQLVNPLYPTLFTTDRNFVP